MNLTGLVKQIEGTQKMKKSVELYKTANAKTSFICESLFGFEAEDGKQYDKIAVILVLRDASNKAQTTVRYYFDIPTAKVLMMDIFDSKFHDEFSEFKQHNGKQRALNIKLQNDGYRISIMNITNGDKHSLYFDVTTWQARELAVTVLDYVRNYELAKVFEKIAISGENNVQKDF